MSDVRRFRWRIFALPLAAACGLQLLHAVTAETRIHNQRLFEARLVNEMLQRRRTAEPDWETLATLPGYPSLRRIRAVHENADEVELWLGWREYGGYAGPLDLAIAFDTDGSVRSVRLLRHTETPGLGDKLEHRNSRWLEQFIGMAEPDAARLEGRGGRVDAMTGATITSAAVARGVARAMAVFGQQADEHR